MEPFQTRRSINGQTEKLVGQIAERCDEPITHGMRVFWPRGSNTCCAIWFWLEMGSLSRPMRGKSGKRRMLGFRRRSAELAKLDPWSGDLKQAMRFLELNDIADTYVRDASEVPRVKFDKEIHESVWPEASALRESGELLALVAKIECPILAIHGDYDRRPLLGVQEPLERVQPSASFAVLERCGHKPWQEVHANAQFYALIEDALS